MPQPDGCQLAGLLREEPTEPAPLLVAVTGFSDEAHRQRAHGRFHHYLIKATGVEALERILAGLAGRGPDRPAEPC
jgi:CheY-like chemotaxis protein